MQISDLVSRSASRIDRCVGKSISKKNIGRFFAIAILYNNIREGIAKFIDTPEFLSRVLDYYRPGLSIVFWLGLFIIIIVKLFAYIFQRYGAQTKPLICKPPGTRFLVFADFIYSPKTMEQIFMPLVADWRLEHFEALKQNRKWKARWISFRYCYSFIMAMSLSKVFSLLKQIRSVSK
jgi:hypothetical protein